MHEEQEKTPAHEKPKYLVEDIGRKIAELDREVKYLINKAKTYKPKVKVEKTESNETETEKTDDSEKEESEKKEEEPVEAEPIQEPPAEEGDAKEEEEILELPGADESAQESSTSKKSGHDPGDEL